MALPLLLALTLPVPAVMPDEVLADKALEHRARKLSSGLRCLVCQNESIDDSEAPLARDLRLLVRERLVAGDTDAEIRSFIVTRYGEFVLLQPVFGPHTLFLWFGPLAILLVAGALVLRQTRKRHSPAAALTEREQERIATLLDERNE